VSPIKINNNPLKYITCYEDCMLFFPSCLQTTQLFESNKIQILHFMPFSQHLKTSAIQD
jgi:hypothetical protein